MKAKALVSAYSDGSGFKVVRIYLEQDFDKAESDLELLQEYGSDSKNWSLEEVEVYGTENKERLIKKLVQLPNELID
jgi:hypothetical protein